MHANARSVQLAANVAYPIEIHYFNSVAHGSIDLKLKEYPIDRVNFRAGPLPHRIAPSVRWNAENIYREAGGAVTLSPLEMKASPPISLQWFHNGEPLASATNLALYLPGISRSSAGRYSIVTSNQWGVITNAATLMVGHKPDIRNPLSSHYLLTGESISFHLFTTGDEPIEFVWTRNGTNISNIAQYTVSSATIEDAGRYEVYARNNFGSSETNVFTVYVIDPPVLAPAVQILSPADVQLSFEFDSRLRFQMQSSSNLLDWRTHTNEVLNGTQLLLSTVGIHESSRFFRLRLSE
jgi:hypothetical protein